MSVIAKTRAEIYAAQVLTAFYNLHQRMPTDPECRMMGVVLYIAVAGLPPYAEMAEAMIAARDRLQGQLPWL